MSPVSCWRAGASAAAPSGPRPVSGSCTQAKGEGCQCGAACLGWVVERVVVGVRFTVRGRVRVRVRVGVIGVRVSLR